MTRTARLPRRPLHSLLSLVALLAVGCSVNPYDPSQKPQVSVQQELSGAVFIHWQPAGAQLVRVYRGSKAGDGYGPDLMWSIGAESRNSIVSGIAYGASPPGSTTDVAAKTLVAGEVYTVQVIRADPRGSGEGFTNTSNRYEGTATFTMTAGPL